jgi:hypothetical protein
MKRNIRHGKPNFFAIALFIGILAVVLIGFLDTNPAYASGLIRVSSNESLYIQFISASTNDSGKRIDPGQNIHVGQCTAIINKKSIDFRIYNGYPGYECTLTVKLKNMSKQAVRLQRLEINAPNSLLFTPPVLPAGFVLNPNKEVTLSFRLRIQQIAKENERYRFTTKLIMEAFHK